jgi:hypothetical protein
MGNPLTVSSDVECGHKGLVAVDSSAKLTVGGNAVLLASGVVSKTVSASCATPSTSTTHPCTSVLSILPTSLATKLTAGGMPVVLDSLSGLTNGLPPGKLMAIAGQSKLTAA